MRILYFTHCFPPLSTPASLRSLLWTRELIAREWKVQIVTIEFNPMIGSRDPDLLELVPDEASIEQLPTISSYPGFPDAYRVISRQMAEKGREILRTGPPPELLISTAYPFSLHLEIGTLAREFKLPWVADWRDPMSQNIYSNPRGRHLFFARLIEETVLKRASLNVVVGETMKKYFKRLLPDTHISVARNVMDRRLLPPRSPLQDRLLIACTGHFYGSGGPGRIIEAVDLVRRELSFPVEIIFAGHGHPALNTLPAYARYAGRLPWRQSLELLASAGLALVDVPSTLPFHVSRRVYEPLAMEMPLLVGTGEETELAAMALEAGAWVVRPTVEGYASALREIAAQFPEIRSTRDPHPFSDEMERLDRDLRALLS